MAEQIRRWQYRVWMRPPGGRAEPCSAPMTWREATAMCNKLFREAQEKGSGWRFDVKKSGYAPKRRF